jgi:hypothetical protein
MNQMFPQISASGIAQQEIIRIKPPVNTRRQLDAGQELCHIPQEFIPGFLTEQVIDNLKAGNVKPHDFKFHIRIFFQSFRSISTKSLFIVKIGQPVIMQVV